MSVSWTRPSTWLPWRSRFERKLDALVVAARRYASASVQASSSTLQAAAEDVGKHSDRDRACAQALGLFAVAAERRTGWTPFDVQLRAAAAMTLGVAVEMQTGEGKTLAVAAAAAALALQSRRVHVATVNQYLAERDHRLFAPVLYELGITVGLLEDRNSWEQKRIAYSCQIVYGTGYAFGFDYLREQLRLLRTRSAKLGEQVRRRLDGETAAAPYQPNLDCTIVDELDAVLLDEAGVPLILSEERPAAVDDLGPLENAARAAAALRSGEHFTLDLPGRTIALTEAGLRASHCSRAIFSQLRRPWRQYLEDALKAAHVLRRDVDYIVADRKVWIVDSSTGRIFDDRRWPEGLQKAVEYREGVPFSPPTSGAARITRQRFFKLYRHLTGTSGTLLEAKEELESTYRLEVCVIPPRLPSQLVRYAPRFFRDAETRDQAVVAAAAEQRSRGRPVLVGCRTIEVSRELSRRFDAGGLAHQMLNGTQSAEEAQVVAQAGRSGNVLIATNLAGRGTDIRLDAAAARAGGLHVIGVEYHDSPRIDRQLLGRAGRQGDVGSGQFFISAADDLWRVDPPTAELIRSAVDADGECRVDLNAAVLRSRNAIEACARARRRDVSAFDGWMDDVLTTLARAE